MITGNCECRAVRFESEGPIQDYSHCHCSQCRRLHGAAFATFAGLARNGFRFVDGIESLAHYRSSATHDRVFCSVCGSNIYVALDDEPDMLYVSMSAIDGDPPRPPGYHIFVGSKAPWHEIKDDLPKYEEFET